MRRDPSAFAGTPSDRAVLPEVPPAPRREGLVWYAVATWLELNPETGHRNATFSPRLESRSRDGLADCRAELRARYGDRSEFQIIELVLDRSTGRERMIDDGRHVSLKRGAELAREARALLRDRSQSAAGDGEEL